VSGYGASDNIRPLEESIEEGVSNFIAKSVGNVMVEEYSGVTERRNTKKTARSKYAKDFITKLISSAFFHIFLHAYIFGFLLLNRQSIARAFADVRCMYARLK